MMDVNDAVQIAERLESLARRIYSFSKSREDIVDELDMIAVDYRRLANRIDELMYAEYLNNEAFAREQYEDAAIIGSGLWDNEENENV